jgi:iron complex transport system substrate-binding protein
LGFGVWDLGLKNKTTVQLLAAAAVLVCCFGCASDRGTPSVGYETQEVRDELGRTIRVPKNIERAISLAPNITEMIFALDAGDRLVGVTTYCNYPPETALIEKVGDTQTPNIEKIIALKPQIVFVSTASQLEAFSQTLEEQGIAVYVTKSTSLTDVFTNLRSLGNLFGKPQTATNLMNKLGARIGDVSLSRGQAKDPLPTVFVQISNEPLFTIGSDSFLTEVVEKAGGVSATKDVPTAYPTLSKERAAALDPDVIILSDSEDNREPNPAFKNSKAVTNGRVYRINADIISRPGPRLVDALEEIAAKLNEKKLAAGQ